MLLGGFVSFGGSLMLMRVMLKPSILVELGELYR